MVSRERSLLAGVTAAALIAVVGAAQVVVAQVGERTISLYNIHTKETVTVAYKKGGKYIEAGLERVNHALRDHRRNETTKMDPELVDLLVRKIDRLAVDGDLQRARALGEDDLVVAAVDPDEVLHAFQTTIHFRSF